MCEIHKGLTYLLDSRQRGETKIREYPKTEENFIVCELMQHISKGNFQFCQR
jgi:hypothetical protein